MIQMNAHHLNTIVHSHNFTEHSPLTHQRPTHRRYGIALWYRPSLGPWVLFFLDWMRIGFESLRGLDQGRQSETPLATLCSIEINYLLSNNRDVCEMVRFNKLSCMERHILLLVFAWALPPPPYLLVARRGLPAIWETWGTVPSKGEEDELSTLAL